MTITTKAIVLSVIKYAESSLIVKCYTASSGVKSYLLRGILASKKGKLKTAYFQPLMQLEIVAAHKNKGTLEHLKEARVSYPFQTVHFDVKKNAIAFFLSEMLHITIHEEEENQSLFQYIETTVQWLDTHDDVANFTLIFLINLTKYLGFYPDESQKQYPFFDLLEGGFIKTAAVNPVLSGSDVELFKVLLDTKLENINAIKATKSQRQQLLNKLILYFELHLQGFRKPKSLLVLNEVFN